MQTGTVHNQYLCQTLSRQFLFKPLSVQRKVYSNQCLSKPIFMQTNVCPKTVTVQIRVWKSMFLPSNCGNMSLSKPMSVITSFCANKCICKQILRKPRCKCMYVQLVFVQTDACKTKEQYKPESVQTNVYTNQCLFKPMSVQINICANQCQWKPMSVQRNVCANQCLCKLITMQNNICKIICLFKIKTVQTRECTNQCLCKPKFVQTNVCANQNLYKPISVQSSGRKSISV